MISEENLLKSTLALSAQQYAFSQGRLYRSGISKSRAGDQFCALLEHEYGGEIKPDDLARMTDGATRCYEHLYGNDILLGALQKGTWYSGELNLPFSLDGITVSAKIDLVFFVKDEMYIIDWKVGESATTDYSSQMLIYTLAAVKKWHKPPEAISLWEVNLLTNEIVTHLVTDARLVEAEDFIFRSVSDIQSLTGDKSYVDLDFHEFACANSPATCMYCKYRSLCLKMLYE